MLSTSLLLCRGLVIKSGNSIHSGHPLWSTTSPFFWTYQPNTSCAWSTAYLWYSWTCWVFLPSRSSVPDLGMHRMRKTQLRGLHWSSILKPNIFSKLETFNFLPEKKKEKSSTETVSSALMRGTGNEKTDEKKRIWIKANVKKLWVFRFSQWLDENISLFLINGSSFIDCNDR